MSLNPFAALEARVNSTVQARLSNAIAVYQGGAAFGVIFDTEASNVFGGEAVDIASCTVGFCVVNTPGITAGSELVIGGVAYEVTGPVQPDAGGWVNLTVFAKG